MSTQPVPGLGGHWEERGYLKLSSDLANEKDFSSPAEQVEPFDHGGEVAAWG
jgi:hypothetical protein